MNQKIFVRIQKKKKELDRHRPLAKSVLERLQKQIALDWTYNSNAIEGNSLTLRETQLVLEDGVTIKGKSLREHFEAKNHERAIQFLMQLVKEKTKLTEDIILKLHALVLDGIEEDFAGRYRNGRVRITGANFVPPNPLKVPDLMERLMEWVKRSLKQLNPVCFAAQLQHRFIWIHPFFDGNGRTGRLLMNLSLMQKGYPPAVILKNDRKKYYDALNQANEGDYEKLDLLVAQAIERSLDLYLEACAFSSVKEEYLLLSELAKKTPYSQEYLSLLARRGRIDAFKISRNWYSSLSAIEGYSKE
ncbi:Fic family protein [Candidatus Peregrinibacteria bacterium]|nr:MAG: Fic family protein [Candidatus Peregrinibacteria bacterium]